MGAIVMDQAVIGTGSVIAAGAVVTQGTVAVSYTHLRAHETVLDLVCRLLLEKKKLSDYYCYKDTFSRWSEPGTYICITRDESQA